jgi:hypothetical protein
MGVTCLIQFYDIQTFIQRGVQYQRIQDPFVYFSLLVESCTGNDSLLTHIYLLQHFKIASLYDIEDPDACLHTSGPADYKIKYTREEYPENLLILTS